jgi:hypothetical protein
MKTAKLIVERIVRGLIALPFLLVGNTFRSLWKVCECITDEIMGDVW